MPPAHPWRAAALSFALGCGPPTSGPAVPCATIDGPPSSAEPGSGRADARPGQAVEAGPSASPAAETGPDPEGSPTGCVERVEGLPRSELVDPDDRRLRRDRLVVVVKSSRRLMVFDHGVASRCFPIGLGFQPRGHKRREGDGRTPEGWYRTSDKPWSIFDGAIAIHYPNAADARSALADGRIGRRTAGRIVAAAREGRTPPQRTALGGAVLIHGGGARSDWTLGCVALDDAQLAELRETLGPGQRTDLLVLP